jgi:hypothetical protein
MPYRQIVKIFLVFAMAFLCARPEKFNFLESNGQIEEWLRHAMSHGDVIEAMRISLKHPEKTRGGTSNTLSG